MSLYNEDQQISITTAFVDKFMDAALEAYHEQISQVDTTDEKAMAVFVAGYIQACAIAHAYRWWTD